VFDNPVMRLADCSDTEQVVVEAFGSGTQVDLRGRQDRVVRSEVIRFLLLGGSAVEAGNLAALWLTGAHITGALEVEHADITVPVSLHDCQFDERISLFGSRLRRLSLQGSVMPGLMAAGATFDATLRLAGCHSTDKISLTVARISGALLLDGARLTALDGTGLQVSGDVVARDGFYCRGELRLDRAEIGGSMYWEGATLDTPGGTVRLSYAKITSTLCLRQATLTGPGTALGCRHLVTRELVLLPARPPSGVVDLSHARIGLLHDDPATWPSALHLDGLTYDALANLEDRASRLRWLRLDPRGFRQQAYTQLAQVYRTTGHDNDARTVLLAGERHRRNTLSWPAKWWGYLQDLTVGYGYRPARAAAWLIALLIVGTVVFSQYPPRAAEPTKAPEFIAPIYTLDLILPVIDFGQQSAFNPRGASAWLAYALILAGLLLVTTIAAAGARRLRRN
jgi:hypothetical protein